MPFDAPFLRQDPRYLLVSHSLSAKLNSTPERPVGSVGSVAEERWSASTIPSCDAVPAPGERLPDPSLPYDFDFSFSRHHSHYFTHPILHTLAALVVAFLEYSTWHCLPESSFFQRFPAFLLAPSAPNQQTAAQMAAQTTTAFHAPAPRHACVGFGRQQHLSSPIWAVEKGGGVAEWTWLYSSR